MSKRKQISKKIRFEVFKRDSFKCQYCGSSAPDVILHVDHIEPISKGGDNSILNLITSCDSCNLGKSDRSLSDDSAVIKQKEQLNELNKRREQLQMMMKWRQEIKSIEEQYVENFCNQYSELVPGWVLNEQGIKIVKSLLRKYSYSHLIESLETSAEKLEFTEELKATQDTASQVLTNISKIAAFKKLPEVEQRIRYIRGIVRNRMYCNESVCLSLLKDAIAADADIEELTEIAKSAKNWTEWRGIMEEIINHG